MIEGSYMDLNRGQAAYLCYGPINRLPPHAIVVDI
jgi:hypothetical protein